MPFSIVSQIQINNNKVTVDGQEIDILFDNDNLLKVLYEFLDLKYAKFHKMDELSKLGFIASELLLNSKKIRSILDGLDKNKVGIILQNSDSSIDVDRKFNESIKDNENYFPSPSLFVYTLANIAIGEIAIRNDFKGEHGLFIFEQYVPDFSKNYIHNLFEQDKIEACIGGYFNANNSKYEAHFYFCVKN